MLVLLGLASMMMLALVIDPSSEDGEGEDEDLLSPDDPDAPASEEPGDEEAVRPIIGTDSDDWLEGLQRDDRITGAGGDDDIRAGGGDDHVAGDDGDAAAGREAQRHVAQHRLAAGVGEPDPVELDVDARELKPGAVEGWPAYVAGVPKTAYVEPVGVGDRLPDMPAYLDDEGYVPVPLEATYQAAWASCPEDMREAVEHGDSPPT